MNEPGKVAEKEGPKYLNPCHPSDRLQQSFRLTASAQPSNGQYNLKNKKCEPGGVA